MDVFDLTGEKQHYFYNSYGRLVNFPSVITAELLPEIEFSGTKQGGCTDGEYIYQSAGDTSDYTYLNIVKYKIADGSFTSVRYDGNPNFGHANDMTYNPDEDRIYIATMMADNSIVILNASDLSYVDTIYLSDCNKIPQIAYNRNDKKYYLRQGSEYLIYDSSWNLVERRYAPPQLSGTTGQGDETDGSFIYRLTYGSTNGIYGEKNGLDILTIDGKRVGHIKIDVPREPESIMYDWNGNYYVSTNDVGELSTIRFYKLSMFSNLYAVLG